MMAFLVILGLVFSNKILLTAAKQDLKMEDFFCPKDWEIYRATCYLPVNDKQNWYNAHDTCKIYGSELLNIEFEEEYMMVQEITSESSFWIGLNTLKQSDANEFDAMWGMETEDKLYNGYWNNDQPNLEAGDCVSGHSESLWSMENCDTQKPFVCKARACLKDYFRCRNSICLNSKWVCDGFNDCKDNSDEMNCDDSDICSQLFFGTSGEIDARNYKNKETCYWTIQSDIGNRIKMTINSFDTEEHADVLDIYSGGSTMKTATHLYTLSGTKPNPKIFYSSNQFAILRLSTDDSNSRSGFFVTWTTEIPEITDYAVLLTAVETFQYFQSPFYLDKFLLSGLQMEWTISTQNANVLTLEFLELDVSPGYVKVYDSIWSGNLNEIPQYAFITHGSQVHIELVTKWSGSRKGINIRYKEGCHITLNDEKSGTIASPGYHMLKYPNNVMCTWEISIPRYLSRSVTMKFEDFELWENSDYLRVYSDILKKNQLHTGNGFTGNVAPEMIQSPTGIIIVEFESSNALMSKGFLAVFSVDCPELVVSEWTNIHTNNQAADVYTTFYTNVELTCENGYSFQQEEYNSMNSLNVECQLGGEWSSNRIPNCQITFCHIPPPLENGYRVSSTDIVFEATATYACNDGFKTIGSTTAKCLGNGQWYIQPICEALTCPVINALSHRTSWAIPEENENEFATVVNFECDPGFDLHGAPRINCQKNGQWSHVGYLTTCKKIICPLPEITDASLSSEEAVQFEDEIEVTCDIGYIINGTTDKKKSIICMTDQTFGDLPLCIDDNECEANPCSNHQSCVNNIGSFICECDDGYMENTDGSCYDIKECETNNGGCSDTCVEAEGSYTCSCPDGWQIYTENELNNIFIPEGEDGSRFGDKPYINHTCVPVLCSRPPKPENGMILTDKKYFYFGDEIISRCDSGYLNLEGSIRQKCMSSATWSPGPLICEIATCDAPNVTPSGSVYTLIPDKSKIDFGETFVVECTVAGGESVSRNLFCQYDNMANEFRLQGDAPICPVIDCGDPIDVPGSIYTRTNGNEFGSSLSFNCASQFEVQGAAEDKTETDNDSSLVLCNKYGRWGFGTLSCRGGRCSDPGTPGGATQFPQLSYEFDQLVDFNCIRDGFKPVPDKPLKCGLNVNSHFEWDAPLPDCRDVTSPTFSSCPTEDIYVDVMSAADYEVPQAMDNSGVVVSVVVDPPYFVPFVIIISDTNVTYTATDDAMNSAACIIKFKVKNRDPPVLVCPSPKTVSIGTKDGVSLNIPDELVSSDERLVRFQFDQLSENVTLDINRLDSLTIVRVEGFDEHDIPAMCSFLIKTEADICLKDYLPIVPNSQGKSCNMDNGKMNCSITCDPDYIFSSGEDTKSFTCTGKNVWSPSIPPEPCQLPKMPSFWIYLEVVYEASYPTKGCEDSHKLVLNAKKNDLNTVLTTLCSVAGQLEIKEISVEAIGVEFITIFSIEADDENISLAKKGICNVYLREDGLSILDNFNYADRLSCGTGNVIPTAKSLSVEENGGSKCGPGQEMIDTKEKCVPCLPGKYYSSSGQRCFACPDKQYQDKAGQTECKQCSIAMQPAATKDHCIALCPEGFWSTTGFFPCDPCSKDTFWTDSSSQCTQCQTGHSTVGITGAKDETFCKAPCAAGTYSTAGYGYEPCIDCPANYYQSIIGSKDCTPCNGHEITMGSGSESQESCVPAITVFCKEDNCNGEGTCSISNHYPVCTCNNDYYGEKCTIYKNPCDAEPCFNGGTCTRDGPSTYTCSCPSVKTCNITETENKLINEAPDKFYPKILQSECSSICLNSESCMNAYITESGGCFIYEKDIQLTTADRDNYILMEKKCLHDYSFEGDQCQNDMLDGCDQNTECGDYGMCHDLPDESNGFECICQITGEYSGDKCERVTSLCDPNPCEHGGTCASFGTERRYCICLPGYTGDNCEKNIGECDINPDGCLHNGTCVDRINGYQCDCLKGFSATAYCEEAPDFCSLSGCSGGLCYNDINILDSVCICEDKFEIGEDGKCNAKDPCDDVRCVNGICRNGVCDCDDGFEGSECQHGEDDCKQDSCVHGTCADEHLTFICSCDDGWEGNNCDSDIDDCFGAYGPCDSDNTMECKDNIADYMCVCKSGFTGKTCSEKIDECETLYPCEHGSECRNEENGYVCDCKEGWEGKKCNEEIDHCKNDPCKNGGNCHNLIDGYFCRCVIGIYGDNCDIFPNVCDVFTEGSEPCINGGKCMRENGETFCSCETGYTGDSCELIKDFCATGLMTCENGGTCFAKTTGYECKCEPGYRGSRCQLYDNTCDDVNCVPGADCYYKGEKSMCLCQKGYTRTGSTCKESSADYDIIFDMDVSPSGAASMFPFVMNSNAISILMFVRFASVGTNTSLLKLSESDVDDTVWPSENRNVLLEVSQTSVTFNNGTVELSLPFERMKLTTDNTWHHIGITWTSDGKIVIFVDAVREHFKNNTVLLPPNKFCKLLVGENFQGRLSRVTIWSQVLSYDDIIQASDDVNFEPSKTLIQAWANFILSAGATRSYPSILKSNKCGPILNGDCPDGEDKIPPLVFKCRDDYSIVSNNRILNINKFTTEDIKFDTEKVVHTLPEDLGFMKGVHEAIFVAKDEEENYSECRFRIYVRYNSGCKGIKTDDVPGLCENSQSYCKFDNCNSKKRFKKFPKMVSCGKLGNWDSKHPYMKLVIPSCSAAEDAFIRVSVKVAYKFSIKCQNSLKMALNTGIENSFKNDVAKNWNGLCNDSQCTNLQVTVTCNNDPQNLSEAFAVIVLSRVLMIVTATGFRISYKEALQMLFLEGTTFEYTIIGGATMLKTSFDVDSIMSCDVGKSLIGDSTCVTCGGGSYIDEETGTCKFCAIGEFQNMDGQTSCQPCLNEKSTLNVGSVAESDCIEKCTAGYYYDQKCKECQVDHYQAKENQIYCDPCPQGKRTKGMGVTSLSGCVDDCLSGYELKDQKSDECVKCKTGYYRTAGNPDERECVACKTGWTTSEEGGQKKEDCDTYICQAGEFWYDPSEEYQYHTDDQDECKSCPLGQYQPEPLQKECIECEESHTTKDMKTVNKTDCVFYCPPGFEYNIDEPKTCNACERGYYRDTVRENDEIFGKCLKCPAATTNMEGSTHSDNCSTAICGVGQIVDPDDNLSCLDCPKDHYQSAVMPTSSAVCRPCPEKTATRMDKRANDSFCESVCLAGEQYNHDTEECENCPQGTWSDGSDSMKFEDCLKCPENMTTGQDGSDEADDCDILDCPPGNYIVGSESEQKCKLCPEGKYQPNYHQTSCLKCGTDLSSAEGSISVDDCNVYCPVGEEGDDECKACADGYFKEQPGSFGCSQCPGDYTSDVSRISCNIISCSMGKYHDASTDESCHNCKQGFYKDVKGNENCTPCPEWSTTSGEGSINKDMCDQKYCMTGSYYVVVDGKETCDKCDFGTFKNVSGNDEECQPCPEGLTTENIGKTSKEACLLHVCDIGEYRSEENECKQCPISQFQNLTGQTSCLSCNEHFTTMDMASVSEEDCVSLCEKGEFYAHGTKECISCELGFYKETVGNINCTKCTQDKTTSGTGSTNINDCNIDDCLPGQMKSSGQGCVICPLATYQNLRSQTKCIACSLGKTTAYKGSKTEKQCIDDCIPGQEYNYIDLGCKKCSIGFITSNNKHCVQCPADETTFEEGAISCKPRGGVTEKPSKKITLLMKIKFKVTNCGNSRNWDIYKIRIKNTVTNNLQRLSGKHKGLCTISNMNCDSIVIKIKTVGSNCKSASNGRRKRLADHEMEFEIEVPNVESVLENVDTGELRPIESVIEEDLSDEDKYTPEPGSIDFVGISAPLTSSVTCEPGWIMDNDECSQCLVGTKQVTNQCDPCQKDYYQDEPGKTTCKKCEEPRSTTALTGSSSEDNCQSICDTNTDYCENGGRCIADDFDVRCECAKSYEGTYCESFKDPSKDSNQEAIIGGAIGGIVGLLVIILISAGIVNFLRKRNSARYDKSSVRSRETEQFRNPVYDNGVFGAHLPGYSHRNLPYGYPVEDYDQMGYYNVYGKPALQEYAEDPSQASFQ